jgi:predicted AAA+ superfamily ATPase
MAITNRDRVNAGLELLYQGLYPYAVREMKANYQSNWVMVAESVLGTALSPNQDGDAHLDTAQVLRLMFQQWNEVFGSKLGHTERSIISELREARNRWAHQETFSGDDTERTLDNCYRLLSSISAPQAQEVRRQYDELRRLRFEEQTRQQRRRQAEVSVKGQPAGNLKPWREIVTPHPDVAGGRYQQAEFVADLGQVHRGEATSEYNDPRAFFQRTYVTEGLRHLLVNAVRRLDDSDAGGDPVIKLQTNFGGGKTHSMLALYHLFSDINTADLPGVDEVLADAGVDQPAAANRAVMVGTARGPAQPETKPDGTVVNTMWGDMAWQLLGKRGYELVAESDRAGTSPGSDTLRELFKQAEPSLILIDEWVAYVRQLYNQPDLPGGSFESNLTFAQALTEAARAVPGTLIVATLPASDIEVGGVAGQEALTRLENTFGRIEAVWKPATANESFEIVRRRLFQEITDPQLYRDRDVTIRAFVDLYRNNVTEFPGACGEGDYERRMRAAYPIHPELFDRLYEDWSSLERFQRTRGVLRLMATVIHTLWEGNDRSLLIMPSTVPMNDPGVQYELTRYLSENWQPIIEQDVDGPHALPVEIDREFPNLGRLSATRRVARSIYMGSAPLVGAATRGLDDRSINLACAQPGESIATFSDALRRLTDRATFLYVDGRRYWYATQASVNRVAQDRAAAVREDQVFDEISRRLRTEARYPGDFSRVHVAPMSSSDVPDERDARLVILAPEHVHSSQHEESPAKEMVREIIDNRGNSPRRYRNTVVFVAPDRTRMLELETAVRLFLAWKSIHDEHEQLDLTAFQRRQAETRVQDMESTVQQRIPETYQWLLIPDQEGFTGPVIWDEIRIGANDRLAVKASKRLKNDEQLFSELGAVRLRMELDRVPLWRGDEKSHVEVRQLCEDFAQYLYLPRLKNDDLLLNAIKQGAGAMMWREETFAYAEGYDETRKRYLGLVTAQTPASVSPSGLVVASGAAIRQRQADEAERQREQTGEVTTTIPGDETPGTPQVSDPQTPTPRTPAPQIRRFYGSIDVDASRANRDVPQIVNEVLQHLTALHGANVRMSVEIEADFDGEVPDQTIRTVSENARVLGFRQFGFEKE